MFSLWVVRRAEPQSSNCAAHHTSDQLSVCRDEQRLIYYVAKRRRFLKHARRMTISFACLADEGSSRTAHKPKDRDEEQNTCEMDMPRRMDAARESVCCETAADSRHPAHPQGSSNEHSPPRGGHTRLQMRIAAVLMPQKRRAASALCGRRRRRTDRGIVRFGGRFNAADRCRLRRTRNPAAAAQRC